MLKTPLIRRFVPTLPTLSFFETMCLNILLMQCRSLPPNSNKIKEKFVKIFFCTEHITVPFWHNTDEEA